MLKTVKQAIIDSPRHTPEQKAQMIEMERQTRILESGEPRKEFLELVDELGPMMQGLSSAQLYFNWLWENGYEEEEYSSISEADHYCIAQIPVPNFAKKIWPDYANTQYVYMDTDNYGMVNERSKSEYERIMKALEKENEEYAAQEEEWEEPTLDTGDTTLNHIYRC